MSTDRSYRLLVMLQRDDREKYWDFYCPRCQALITQVNNGYIQSISDTFNPSEYGQSIVCPSRYCRIRFYFQLSD